MTAEKPVLRVRQIVDAGGLKAFHHAFGGANAIHVDEEAARKHGGLVQHGMRTLFPVFALLVRNSADEEASRICIEAKFLAPVKAGEQLETIIQSSGASVAEDEFEISSVNDSGVKVLVGKASRKR